MNTIKGWSPLKTFEAKALTESSGLFRKGETVVCRYDSTVGDIDYLQCAPSLADLESPMRRVYLASFLVEKMDHDSTTP